MKYAITLYKNGLKSPTENGVCPFTCDGDGINVPSDFVFKI